MDGGLNLLLFFLYCLTKLHSWKRLRGLKPCQQNPLHKLPKSPHHAHRNQAKLHHQKTEKKQPKKKKTLQVIVSSFKIHPYKPALRNRVKNFSNQNTFFKGQFRKPVVKISIHFGVFKGSNNDNIQSFVQIEHVYRIVLFNFKIPTLHMRSTHNSYPVFFSYH